MKDESLAIVGEALREFPSCVRKSVCNAIKSIDKHKCQDVEAICKTDKDSIWQPGKKVGCDRYIVLGLIGAGAKGQVYAAIRATESFHLVALKRISVKRTIAGTEVAIVNRLKSLKHANLLEVFDHWKVDNDFVLVLELGHRALREGGPYSINTLQSFLEGIAAALDCLHEQGLVHQDVKPSNIILVGDSEDNIVAKLGDFGGVRKSSDSEETQCNTDNYASPEVRTGKPATPFSDQFSLAISYIHLRSGSYRIDNLARDQHFGHYERQALLRATNEIPEERFRSCKEFWDSLKSGTVLDFSKIDFENGAKSTSVQDRNQATCANEIIGPNEQRLTANTPLIARTRRNWETLVLVVLTLGLAIGLFITLNFSARSSRRATLPNLGGTWIYKCTAEDDLNKGYWHSGTCTITVTVTDLGNQLRIEGLRTKQKEKDRDVPTDVKVKWDSTWGVVTSPAALKFGYDVEKDGGVVRGFGDGVLTEPKNGTYTKISGPFWQISTGKQMYGTMVFEKTFDE